tara:strand:+ start:61 stop:243 length:183 start_codon:yes stop_codon:yes gene_type:complete
MDMINVIKDWILARWSERTTWDGGVIIAVSLSYILLGGLVDWLAWIALAYGVFTLIKSEL